MAPGHVAAFCEILEPPSPIPTQVNGTQVEIQLMEGFARVVIVKEFYNPSDVFKEGQVFFPLEKGHELITDLSLKIGNVVYNSTAQDRGGALDEFLDALANGRDAALVQYDPPRDVYWIAVTIPPRESRTTITTLELPLTARDGFYEYDYRLSVDAGHSVSYLRVHVRVETSAKLGEVSIPTHPGLAVLRRGTRVAESFINSSRESQFRDLTVRFRTDGPSVAQYADPATGDRYVRFSVEAADPIFAGSLRPLPRSFLFAMDASGSMGRDGRWPLAREAAVRLARDLRPGESLAAAVFQGNRVRTFADALVESTPDSLMGLGTFLASISPGGSTSLTVALPWIERWAVAARGREQEPILFLLSDGRPTVGDADLELENAYKRISYDNDLSVFALAVKPRVHADENLLRNVSHLNSGDLFTLSGSDPTDALSKVLGSVRVPVLHGVRAEFPESAEATFASANPQAVVQGGEVLAIAKLRGAAGDPIHLRLSWSDRLARPASFDHTFSGDEVPAPSLLKKQWVLARVHSLLEAARANADPAAIEAVKDLASAHRVVTPYTSLLVEVPVRGDSQGLTGSELRQLRGDFLPTGANQGLFTAGPAVSQLLASPLTAVGEEAEAFWADVQNPLLVDDEIDRTVGEDTPEHRAVGLEAANVRFQGRFLTIVEVNGELVAIVRGWLDPADVPWSALWTGVWTAAAGLTLGTLLWVRRRPARERVDEDVGRTPHAARTAASPHGERTGAAEGDQDGGRRRR